jgi:hypothetical protein
VHRRSLLLRLRGERPGGGCASYKCDELTPSHGLLEGSGHYAN